MSKQAVEALRRGDAKEAASAIASEPSLARKPQIILGAAGLGNLALLNALVTHGADLNAKWRGYRPLHALIQGEPHQHPSVSSERLACLNYLLGHGADPEQLGAWPPARAIVVAAFGGEADYVACLREGGARIDPLVSCALGEAAAVRGALKKDAGFANVRDAGGLTPLQCCVGSRLGRSDPAVHGRLLDIAEMLLDAGADPNARTRSWSHDIDAAYLAVSARSPEALDLLLARGADATAALPSAAWCEDPGFAEICLRRGARMNEARSGDRPLLNDLVRWGQMKQALRLLERGADPNVPDAEGWTAVHQAASRGNERMFAAILKAGGDLGRKDRRGVIPIDIALARGRAKIVALAAARAS